MLCVPQALLHRSAGKIGQRAGDGPSEIVDADQAAQAVARFPLAHQPLQGRPGEAHANGGHDNQRHGRPHRRHLAAEKKGGAHDGQAQPQRGKVSGFLGKAPGVKSKNGIDQSDQRGQFEVLQLPETEFLHRVKIDVIKEISRGQRVGAGEGENAGLQAGRGDAAMGRARRMGGRVHGWDGRVYDGAASFKSRLPMSSWHRLFIRLQFWMASAINFFRPA